MTINAETVVAVKISEVLAEPKNIKRVIKFKLLKNIVGVLRIFHNDN